MDEAAKLEALKAKDEAALSWFIDRYAAYVGTIVYNIIGETMSGADVEEVAADVFLTLWANAVRIRPGKVKAYLSGTARNKAKEKTRSMGRELPLEDDIIVVSGDDPARDIEEREQALFLKSAILSLQYPEREIFLRHYYYCQSVARISAELGLNPSTVKTKLRRGREKLKEELRKGGYDVEAEDIRHDGQHTG